MLLLLTPALHADTRLIFPRVLFQKDHWIGVALANPTNLSAQVTLTAYNLDGTLFAGTGITNPAVRTVASGSQYVALAFQIFSAPASLTTSETPTRLWMEATSTVDGLTGFFLEGHDGTGGIPDYLAGSDLSGSGTDLALPIVENNAPSLTEISIVNPDTDDANLSVDFFAADGTSVNKTTKVPKRGGLQGPLSDLFTIAYDQVVALRVRSDRPIHCYGSVFRSSDPSLVTIAGQNGSAPSKTLQFPQLAEGDNWSTGVGVQNVSNAAILATFTAYQSDGTLFAAPTVKENPVTRQIKAGGVYKSSLKDLFQIATGPLKTGWLKVDTAAQSIIGYVEYSFGTTRALVPAQTRTFPRLIFSYQYLGSPYFTGLAVLNSSSLATSVEVFSLDSSGLPIGKTQHLLTPGQKEALVMQQWIPATDGNPKANGGSVFVRTDNPAVATQLWGTNTVSALANISPQEVTADFDPGTSLPKVTVSPSLAVVETKKSRQFTATGASNLTWSIGGSASDSTLGSISSGGLYQAPDSAPASHNITIQASTPQGDTAAGATVDVINRDTLVSGLGLLSSVAYLDNLQRFFIAEQQLLSSEPSIKYGATAASTKISEVSTNQSTSQYFSVPNDTISKMLAFVNGGNTYLLLAGFDAGKIYRLRVDNNSKEFITIATGLNKPNSMATDPLTGNLLVSELGANQIRIIPASQVATGSEPGFIGFEQAPADNHLALIPAVAPQGVAVNPCTGAVYVTLADGTLHEYVGDRDKILVSGLNQPGQIQILFREGLPCAEGLTIAVAEAGDVLLIVPAKSVSVPMLGNLALFNDLTYFPKGNPFIRNGEASLIIGENWQVVGRSLVTDVPLGGIYQKDSPSPLPAISAGGWPVPFQDPVGDTFATTLSTSQGLAVTDIASVASYSLARPTPFGFTGPPYAQITVTFNSAIASLASKLPNSIDGSIFLNTGKEGVQIDRLNRYNPGFQTSGTGVTYEVNIGREKLIDTSTLAEQDVIVRYYGTSLSILIPNQNVDLAKTKAILLIGNRAEMTDVVPNAGVLQLAP